MKELDLATLVAVFQEMLGVWLWMGLAAAALATLAFLFVLVRDRGVVSSRLVWSELAGVAGGVAAVLIMQSVTNSGFRDIGGPIDWILVALIFLAGAVGTIVGVYALAGLVAGRRVGNAARESAGSERTGRFAPLPR
jgi:uncharacterized membrane protein YhaH (DUF805 family)